MKLNSQALTKALVLYCLASTTLFLCLLLFYSFYGFDFTDEGFYLNWFKYSEVYPAASTFFGFFYQTPFRILSENVFLSRAFNVLSLYLLGCWIISKSLSNFETISASPNGENTNRLLITVSLAGLTLVGVGQITTPNYNHLALMGCIITAGILLPLADRPATWIRLTPREIITLAIGLSLAMLAKPTTGISLIALLLIYAFLSPWTSKYRVLLAVLASLLISTGMAIAFAGNLESLYSRISLGLHWAALLGSGHNASGLVKTIAKCILFLPLLAFPVVVKLQTYILSSYSLYNKDRGHLSKLKSLFVILIFIFLFLALFSQIPDEISRNTLVRLNLFTAILPFSVIIFSSYDSRQRLFLGSLTAKNPKNYIGPLILLMIPLCYGFGSNTGIWIKALTASVVYIAISVRLLSSLSARRRDQYLPGLLACCCLSFLIAAPAISASYSLPYRQPQPLWLNRSITTIGAPESKIVLSQSASNYINTARAQMIKHGFNDGDAIIDMTGQSPGLIFALSGKAVGQPWIIGGYPGSQKVGAEALSLIPCQELHNSWFITEPGGPRSLDLSTLKSLKIDLSDQSRYEKVVELETPPRAARGGNPRTHPRIQIIYKSITNSGIDSLCKRNQPIENP